MVVATTMMSRKRSLSQMDWLWLMMRLNQAAFFT